MNRIRIRVGRRPGEDAGNRVNGSGGRGARVEAEGQGVARVRIVGVDGKGQSAAGIDGLVGDRLQHGRAVGHDVLDDHTEGVGRAQGRRAVVGDDDRNEVRAGALGRRWASTRRRRSWG